MTAKRPDLPRHPLWPTVIILTLSAIVGAIIGYMLSLGTSLAAATATGPAGMIAFGPLIFATFGAAAPLVLLGTPLWALGGGRLFARMASGKSGAANTMGVTFFSETHEISKVTQRLAEVMGLPPVAYIGWFPNEEINAFAMGTNPNNTLIAVSKGAVERLTKKELISVIGHELGHVASNDMARMTQARGIQNALSFFLIFRGFKLVARWIFTPLSELELLRLSRAREFTADRISAMMLGAEGMISALQKLQQEKIVPKTHGHAHVLMWAGFSNGGLFNTHPPLEQRIARLQAWQASRKPAPQPAPVPAAVPAQ